MLMFVLGVMFGGIFGFGFAALLIAGGDEDENSKD